MYDYDIAIVGAGMVGATFACALANTPLRIALLEAKQVTTALPEQGFDLRVSAITRATQQILESLAIWPKIQTQRISPFREMHVWDAKGEGMLHFDSAELGEALLGHIIENQVILHATHARLDELDNVTLHCPAVLKKIDWLPEQAILELETGDTLSSKLVVAADGSHSWVRDQAKISVRGWDYDQTALVTYVKTALSHQETAWQRFLPEGPLAFLPLNKGYSSIVWSTTPARAEELKTMSEADFCSTLQYAFEERLGEVQTVGPRTSFPLRFAQAEHYICPRLALIGDAAHTVHPLAGQGVNLGFADAAALAQVLQEALEAHRDIASVSTLRRYERWRKAENRVMLGIVDSLKRVFASDLDSIQWTRNMGMGLINKLPPLKNVLMRHAMGLSGDLPKLARIG